MPKFTDGYKTTLGSRTPTVKLSEALNECLITDNLLAASLDVKKRGEVYPVFITALQDSEEKIPLFSHPFLHRTRDGKQILATDVRLYLKKKVFDGSLMTLPAAMLSKVEFNFARSRAILNLLWIEGDVESLKTSLSFSTMMFARMISDVIYKAYALDARDQQLVSIVASYYYQSLFTDETTYDEETLQKWQIHTCKVTKADPNTVKEVFAKMPEMKNVSSLCDAIKLATENVRLDNLNTLSLLTLLRNVWYGINSKDIIAIATEHPPTWMAIVYAALEERSFRKTAVFQIAERVGKHGTADDYVKQYHKILAEYDISSTERALAMEGIVEKI